MSRKKILLIGGSLNQTTIMHAIGQHLEADFDCFYTPYYGDRIENWFADRGLVDWTVMGGKHKALTLDYIAKNRLNLDVGGQQHQYDLVLTGSDLLVPKNIRKSKLILVQEGMTDPVTVMYYIVKWFRLPLYFASTATSGLSDRYDYFCVASQGYRDLFIKKGVKAEKILVTGIPNFDNAARFLANDFPHRGYALIATSDARETFKIDRRKRFLQRAKALAGHRQIIVKLHPNERLFRAKREIQEVIPTAKIYDSGPIEGMIANCDMLICQYSSVAYLGLALGKKVHSYFDEEALQAQLPIQNGGKSGKIIAAHCKAFINNQPIHAVNVT